MDIGEHGYIFTPTKHFIVDEYDNAHTLCPGDIVILHSDEQILIFSADKIELASWISLSNDTICTMYLGTLRYSEEIQGAILFPAFLHDNQICIVFSCNSLITFQDGYTISIDDLMDTDYNELLSFSFA